MGWNKLVQLGLDIDGEAADDRSGQSVLPPLMKPIGDWRSHRSGNGLDAGHVRVYEWDGISWIQVGLDIDGEAAGDISGRSVSLSSDEADWRLEPHF